MKLLENWRSILTQAWSVHLLALGGCAELVLQYLGTSLPGWAVILLIVLTIGARIVSQPGLSNPEASE